jgi:hypothetical protein
MRMFLTAVILTTILVALPTQAHAAILTPAQRARLNAARTLTTASPLPARSATRIAAPAKKQSMLSQIWNSVGSAVLGSAGVAAGAVVAWYTLRKKKKTFTTYYEQIKAVQMRYMQALQTNMDKTIAANNFKKELTLIEEEAELNAAEKKLDQEQLTAIVNKVQRMIDEVTQK